MEWKVKIIDNPSLLGKEVFIYQLHGEQVTYVGKDFHEHTVTRGASIEHGLILNEDQLRAFAQALGELGVHPQKEYIEGKLEATESHLKDMRKLLKLK